MCCCVVGFPAREPGAIAYLAKPIIDAVAIASRAPSAAHRHDVLRFLAGELGAVVVLLALQRALYVCDALLRVRLAQGEFEDPTLQDELPLIIDGRRSAPSPWRGAR